MSFEELPNESILDLALFLPDMVSLCLTNSRFNDVICNNNFFWREKSIKNYGNVYWEGIWKE